MSLFDGKTYSPELDSERLSGQQERVRHFMSDNQWHTLQEISEKTNVPLSTVGSRVRDNRKEKHGGFTVERRRVGDSGLFEYKLSSPTFQFDQDGQGVFA